MTSITLPAQIESLGPGLAFVTACAAAEGFPPERVATLELAVEEALANICHYAYPDSTGAVEIHCLRDGTQQFLVTLIDTGVEFNILAVPPSAVQFDVDQAPIGRQGIRLILAMVDHVTYCREGTRNILRLAVRLPR
jgi:serine/threonine-protein kinase RsbW